VRKVDTEECLVNAVIGAQAIEQQEIARLLICEVGAAMLHQGSVMSFVACDCNETYH